MSPTRKPLHQRSESQTNTHAGIRLVSPEPLLLGPHDDIPTKTPLPTHPAHVLTAGRKRLTRGSLGHPSEFHTPIKRQAKDVLESSPISAPHDKSQIVTPARSGTALSATKRNPLPKKRLVVRLRDGQKTFSLIQQEEPVQEESSPSIQSSAASLQSVDPQPSVAISYTSFPSELTLVNTPSFKSKHSTLVDTSSTSPWNYQFIGGLRKVAKTPDLKLRVGSDESHLPPLPETTIVPRKSLRLSTKASFRSIDSVTTVSENTNYKVYRAKPNHSQHPSISESEAQSPQSPLSPLSFPHFDSEPQTPVSDEAELFSTSREPVDDLVRELSLTPESVIHRPELSDSEDNENYILHGELSPTPSFPDLGYTTKERYSQESLVIRPLRPRAQRSSESFGYYKQRSRETLRTVGSFTSISSVLSQQEASRAIVGTGSIVTLPFPPQSRARGPCDPNHLHPQRSHMNETPHVWSSQLSTVVSVSDGSNRNSRAWSDEMARRSSGTPRANSRNSRHILDLDTGIAEQDGSDIVSMELSHVAMTHGLQRYLNESPAAWLVDREEQEDVITPMQDLRTRPSRRHMTGYVNMDPDNGRTSTMKSTASSIANSNLGTSIPTWAKVYYGSGERKYLGAPGSSTEGSVSRSNSYNTNTGSPNTDHFPLSIYSPRRRPREIGGRHRPESMDITPIPGHELQDPYSRRLRTWNSMSSLWSPHLRHDRRANSRVSIWEPPSVNWSTEGSFFGRRNVQIVMFIMGFLLPFTWMIAALLPLPPDPNYTEKDANTSTEDLDDSEQGRGRSPYFHTFRPVDEARYESARWWRRLNRWMCLVGVLIIIIVIILLVVGTREKW